MEGFSCLEQRLKEEAAVADAGVTHSCGLSCWSDVLQTLQDSSSEITNLQVAFAAAAWQVCTHISPCAPQQCLARIQLLFLSVYQQSGIIELSSEPGTLGKLTGDIVG